MDIIEKQLEYLNQTMKETAAEANGFLLKYHFGGLVAVLALLNIDLVLLRGVNLGSLGNGLLFLLASGLIVYLSYRYFRFVLIHYGRFVKSHRKLKYKYELTLSFALCADGSHAEYQYYMEQGLVGDFERAKDRLPAPTPDGYPFTAVADYLLNHHRIRFQDLAKVDINYLWMALLIILLTLVIRIIFLLIGS